MSLDTEAFQKEIDTALDTAEAEAETAAGVRGAEVSEETTSDSENTEIVEQETESGSDPEVAREEAEATKVLGEETEEKIEDSKTEIGESFPIHFDNSVLARAVACGISLSEAKSFPDNRALASFVNSVEENLVPEAVLEKEPTKKDDEPDMFAGLPELNPEDYSPEVLQHLDRFKQVLTKQQEQLNASEQRTDSVNDSMLDAGEAEMRGWFDKAIANLGDDYKETLGEGAFGLLAQESQEFGNRNDIAGHMALMHDGYTVQGRTPPDREALFTAAVRAVLPDAQVGIERRKLEGDLEQQASQHIQRAHGASNKSVKSPEDETAALLDDKYG